MSNDTSSTENAQTQSENVRSRLCPALTDASANEAIVVSKISLANQSVPT
jgi:hypothetical protein